MMINKQALQGVSTKDLQKAYAKVFPKALEEVLEGKGSMPAYKVAIQFERELKRRQEAKGAYTV